MKYLVMFCTPVESFEIASFVEIQDAKEFANSRVKGYTEVDPSDNVDRNNHFWIEVYDTYTATVDDPTGNLVYETKRVYND